MKNIPAGSAPAARSSVTTRQLVMAAMFAALTLIATFVIRIQTPAFGYIHLGDVFVLLGGIVMGPVLGAAAAGLGSALADLFGGYAIFAPGTLVTKFLTAFVCALLYGKLKKRGKMSQTVSLILAGLVGEAIMVAGYFLYNTLIICLTGSGFTHASIASALTLSVAEIPFNIVQGASGIILSAVLAPVFIRTARMLHITA